MTKRSRAGRSAYGAAVMKAIGGLLPTTSGYSTILWSSTSCRRQCDLRFALTGCASASWGCSLMARRASAGPAAVWGLAIVRQAAVRLRGHVILGTGLDGRGCRFTAQLPAISG
jgi:hypothetical protein